MRKVLLVNPSKWGRGITPIWIPSHAAALQAAGHQVELFDATFFREWTTNELAFNNTVDPSAYLGMPVNYACAPDRPMCAEQPLCEAAILSAGGG